MLLCTGAFLFTAIIKILCFLHTDTGWTLDTLLVQAVARKQAFNLKLWNTKFAVLERLDSIKQQRGGCLLNSEISFPVSQEARRRSDVIL